MSRSKSKQGVHWTTNTFLFQKHVRKGVLENSFYKNLWENTLGNIGCKVLCSRWVFFEIFSKYLKLVPCRTHMNSNFHCLKPLQKFLINPMEVSKQRSIKIFRFDFNLILILIIFFRNLISFLPKRFSRQKQPLEVVLKNPWEILVYYTSLKLFLEVLPTVIQRWLLHAFGFNRLMCSA